MEYIFFSVQSNECKRNASRNIAYLRNSSVQNANQGFLRVNWAMSHPSSKFSLKISKSKPNSKHKLFKVTHMSRQSLKGALHFNDQLDNYLHKRLTTHDLFFHSRTPQQNAIFNTHTGQTAEKFLEPYRRRGRFTVVCAENFKCLFRLIFRKSKLSCILYESPVWHSLFALFALFNFCEVLTFGRKVFGS